jgi:hypothetical protein
LRVSTYGQTLNAQPDATGFSVRSQRRWEKLCWASALRAEPTPMFVDNRAVLADHDTIA